MSVRRFDVDCNGGWEGCTTYENENEWGDYVAHDDYAALLARHNALREAVAWERETDECGEWLHLAWWDEPKIDLLDIWDIHNAARAEVDRLLSEDF